MGRHASERSAAGSARARRAGPPPCPGPPAGATGHSAGGTAVAQALHEDRRIAAAVNLEGHLDQMDGELLPVARQATDRPLLLAGTDGFRDARLDRSWAALLDHGGPVARQQLDDTHHWVFTDYASLVPQLQQAGLMAAAGRASMTGRADPRVTVPAVRNLVRSFFARHLPRRAPLRPLSWHLGLRMAAVSR
ncbi:hypothetical protein ACIA98_16865 [Streptomyces sp. NPDC051366]|uniref:hypothetical protein n=1 Tax=Streptomyces sp. NPDC051366 TaxID=3365652 RepID=UPI0037A84E1F